MLYFVYVLRSNRDNKRYIGISDNVERRLSQHNKGKVPSTKSRIPLKIEYIEEFPTMVVAREREKYFKTAAGRRFLNKKSFARVAELADAYV